MMDKVGGRGVSCRAAICGVVLLLSATAFSCSLAAEFRKVKDKDMKLDGSLCSLPKSSAFELGVAAIAFLTVAQLVGTTAAATTMCASNSKTNKSAATRGRVASVALLVLSWVCFALAVILLATAASMNSGQRYGWGWMDGNCYVAKNGVFGGAAALVVVTALLILGLTVATKPAAAGTTTAPMSCARGDAACTTSIRVDAATDADADADAEQQGGRSKQWSMLAPLDRIRGRGGPTGEEIDGTLRCSYRKRQTEWGIFKVVRQRKSSQTGDGYNMTAEIGLDIFAGTHSTYTTDTFTDTAVQIVNDTESVQVKGRKGKIVLPPSGSY